MIRFRRGYKYQLVSDWEWALQHKFTIARDYSSQFYWVSKSGFIGARTGCAWDGASGGFPDFDWIMEASLGHDILHWLIADGVIPESENDLIDAELEAIILARGNPRFKWFTRFRGWYVKTATHLVDQKRGEQNPIIQIPRP